METKIKRGKGKIEEREKEEKKTHWEDKEYMENFTRKTWQEKTAWEI